MGGLPVEGLVILRECVNESVSTTRVFRRGIIEVYMVVYKGSKLDDVYYVVDPTGCSGTGHGANKLSEVRK